MAAKITRDILESYLHCKYKGFLKLTGQQGTKSDYETLLTEILNTRSLRSLYLVRLAPTVLASAKPQGETLAALRAAGHAPAGLRTDGSPAIEVPRRRRAAPPPTEPDGDDMFALPRLSDPADVARIVLGNR